MKRSEGRVGSGFGGLGSFLKFFDRNLSKGSVDVSRFRRPYFWISLVVSARASFGFFTSEDDDVS